MVSHDFSIQSFTKLVQTNLFGGEDEIFSMKGAEMRNYFLGVSLKCSGFRGILQP